MGGGGESMEKYAEKETKANVVVSTLVMNTRNTFFSLYC
jgi:hypothetical protein